MASDKDIPRMMDKLIRQMNATNTYLADIAKALKKMAKENTDGRSEEH